VKYCNQLNHTTSDNILIILIRLREIPKKFVVADLVKVSYKTPIHPATNLIDSIYPNYIYIGI
jgi:hypothetical protein